MLRSFMIPITNKISFEASLFRVDINMSTPQDRYDGYAIGNAIASQIINNRLRNRNRNDLF